MLRTLDKPLKVCYSLGSDQIKMGVEMIQNPARTRIYWGYRHLDRLHVEKYRKLIYAADPRVGLETAFHLAHNWGNAEAKQLLSKYQDANSALNRRSDREYHRLPDWVNA